MENDFFKDLRNAVKGEVRLDSFSKRIYSVDASIYEVEPLAILIPYDVSDIVSAIKIAAKYSIPVTARGAATGITGACLSQGLIIDTAQTLNRILEVNIAEEYAICEPGVVQDHLNEVVAPYGYRLGPETSTGNRATLAGMVSNNAAGSHSLLYGRMVDHVMEVELLLSNGDLITLTDKNEAEWDRLVALENTEGKIYNTFNNILVDHREAILKAFPRIPRHATAYNLDALIGGYPKNLSKIIVGAEGTLGIITKIKVSLSKKPAHSGIAILFCNDLIEPLKRIKTILAYHPSAVELIDDKILEAAKYSPAVKNKLEWILGSPKAIFVAEFNGNSDEEVVEKLNVFASDKEVKGLSYSLITTCDPIIAKQLWDVRKAGLGLLLSKRSYSRAIAFIEDVAVAPEKLGAFMEAFCSYLKSVGKEAGIYGHVGPGCMHIRPYIDLRDPKELKLMQDIIERVSQLVLDYGGAMSGEHGAGLVRSWLNERLFGQEVYQAFKEIKEAFDPINIMNPGKITDGQSFLENLRLTPKTNQTKFDTFLDFSPEGGFELSADLCNGNGSCRKAEGVMCPSFQVTNDEYYTTRARAQSLRAIINGHLPKESFTSRELYDVMDLCIECKGCKSECPSRVDMAKMKAEFLYHYQEKHGYSLRNRLFSKLRSSYRFMSKVPVFVNWFQETLVAKLFLRCFGITPHRPLPKLPKETFSTWFYKQKQEGKIKSIVLFNDTYTEYNSPEIGKAAYKLLQAMGYHIILSNQGCCGRPAISKGLLKEAKDNARSLLEKLANDVEGAEAIIVLEPSCHSAFRDDYKGLLGADHPLLQVTSKAFLLEEFISQHVQDGHLPIELQKAKYNVLVHGHCHQKALSLSKLTLEVLSLIPAMKVEEIASGCCGMAGSFGYEAEHYDVSMRIGNLHLLPRVKEAPLQTAIIANGTSCRSQITHGTHREAKHLAEVLADHLI